MARATSTTRRRPALPMLRAPPEALNMRLAAGRFLTIQDTTSPVIAMLVNEAFVNAYFNDGRPAVGRRFAGMFAGMLGRDDAVVEVVGVVGGRAGAGSGPGAATADPRAAWRGIRHSPCHSRPQDRRSAGNVGAAADRHRPAARSRRHPLASGTTDRQGWRRRRRTTFRVIRHWGVRGARPLTRHRRPLRRSFFRRQSASAGNRRPGGAGSHTGPPRRDGSQSRG